MPRQCATSRPFSGEREAMATTSVCSPFCIAGMTFFTPIRAVLNTPKRNFFPLVLIRKPSANALLAALLHLFQGLAFCLPHRSPYKGERDRCGYGVERVSTRETDCAQQGQESYGNREISSPIGGAGNSESRSPQLIGKHLA